MQRAINVGLAIYFFTFFFEGVLRYVLFALGLEKLIYVRDGILLAAVLVSLARYLRPSVNALLCTVVAILLCHFAVGLFYIGNPLQVMFGMKLYLPLLWGVVLHDRIPEDFSTINKVAAVYFILTVAGVFANYFMTFPWEGLTYYIDGKEITGSLQWWTFSEQRRLAGFARTSFDAAIFALVPALFLVLYLRSTFWKCAVWICAGAAIALTTTKGILLVYALLTAFYILRRLPIFGDRFFLRALWIPAFLVVAAPVFSAFASFDLTREYGLQTTFLASYADRMENTWPNAFHNVENFGDYFFGRGIGGIGTPQMYYEPMILNYADNLFVYLYANFGLFALAYIGFVLVRLQRLRLDSRVDLMVYSIAVLAIGFGLTAGVVENATISILMGAMLMKLSALRSQVQQWQVSEPAMVRP